MVRALERGETPVDALMQALQPFEGMVDELIACLPHDLADRP